MIKKMIRRNILNIEYFVEEAPKVQSHKEINPVIKVVSQ